MWMCYQRWMKVLPIRLNGQNLGCHLKKNNITITYPIGGKLTRMWDVLRSSVKLGMYPEGGVRWACRAYELALKLCKENHYDAVLTRSPSDIPHIIGLRLKEKLGIRWIANWNDPCCSYMARALYASFFGKRTG